jgi:hypothetical protein
MPSQKHEAMVLLFRNRPALAAELLRETLGIEVPLPIAARLESAALTGSRWSAGPATPPWACRTAIRFG